MSLFSFPFFFLIFFYVSLPILSLPSISGTSIKWTLDISDLFSVYLHCFLILLIPLAFFLLIGFWKKALARSSCSLNFFPDFSFCLFGTYWVCLFTKIADLGSSSVLLCKCSILSHLILLNVCMFVTIQTLKFSIYHINCFFFSFHFNLYLPWNSFSNVWLFLSPYIYLDMLLNEVCRSLSSVWSSLVFSYSQ